MLILKGTHGTTLPATEDIAKNNSFQKTIDGYTGSGVYFWRFNDYAKDLAILFNES